MKPMAPASIAALGATIVLAFVLVSTEASIPADASEPGGMDAMSIDMNPHAIPANTATSIGSREFCARINENDLLDADEDDIDTLEIDVTTGPQGIPESTAMLAFNFAVLYSPQDFVVVGSDVQLMLSAEAGSQVLPFGDLLPDQDGDFAMSVADVSVGSEESGPGVLARLKFQTTQGATEGIQHLLLDPDQAAHIDALNNPYPADTLNHAIAAIDTACPSTQPPPSSPPTLAPPPPFTTPTITPMATPVPLPPGEGGMDAMSIDMNPHDTPANTATSIGSREFCARINANDLLDADEVDVDILEIDVTTGPEGIPETNPMIALSFTLLFEEGQIRVIGNDVRMLLDAEPFGSVLDASELLPDSDGQFGVTALDINTDVTESGPGVLSRIRIEPTVDTLPGIHYLLLDGAVHIDIAGAARVPETLNHAVVAIGVDCPSVQPPPPAPPRPDNDDFASAKALTIPTGRPSRNIEGEYGYFNTTASATSETGKPLLCEEIGKTVWYAFTSTEDGETIFDMQSTAFGPVVAVYTGDDLESLALVSCAPINREASEVSINTVAGETYFVQIGGRDGATGNVVFAYWSEPDATSTPTSSPSPTVTPTALLPTATACICDPLIRGIGGAGPAALPATGGTPQANSDGPITALGIAGLGIVAAAAWAIAHALRRS